MITAETIIEFQETLKEEYHKDVSFEEASHLLRDLTTYFDVLSKIYHGMQTEKENDIIIKPD